MTNNSKEQWYPVDLQSADFSSSAYEDRIMVECLGVHSARLIPAAQFDITEAADSPQQHIRHDVRLEEAPYMRPLNITRIHARENDVDKPYTRTDNGAMATSLSSLKNDAAHLTRLKTLWISDKELRDNGYVMDEMTEDAIERKKRCAGCKKMMGTVTKNTNNQKADEPHTTRNIVGNQYRYRIDTRPIAAPNSAHLMPMLRCKFHSANAQRGRGGKLLFSCCGQPLSAPPCSGTEYHQARRYTIGEIEGLWRHHPTPTPTSPRDIRAAVALDCEMGTSLEGDSELIRVTMIDYFTSDVLLDSLVYPDAPMQHFNTRYSGVTARQINEARRSGTCIFGRDRARWAVWKFVGPDTVVVGHAANNDLTALRWTHPNVVDTVLLDALRPSDGGVTDGTNNDTTEPRTGLATDSPAGEGGQFAGKEMQKISLDGPAPTASEEKSKNKSKIRGPMSLKTLTMLRLGRSIQVGKNGHDSLEDAIASRDLAEWVVQGLARDQHTTK